MAPRHRANPLALAVLMCLMERPMHPYEMATTLRERGKHESIRLNYGSLYGVIESLQRQRLIVTAQTQKEGKKPERTVYGLTPAGEVEALDWLSELVSVPVKEYPGFAVGLSFLVVLFPDQAADCLEQRAGRLEMEMAQRDAVRESFEKHRLPRLLWVEEEYIGVLKKAELDYVKQLARDIRRGEIEGLQWWRQLHEEGVEGPPEGFTPFGQDVEDSYDPSPGGPGGLGADEEEN